MITGASSPPRFSETVAAAPMVPRAASAGVPQARAMTARSQVLIHRQHHGQQRARNDEGQGAQQPVGHELGGNRGLER